VRTVFSQVPTNQCTGMPMTVYSTANVIGRAVPCAPDATANAPQATPSTMNIRNARYPRPV
jgi:hypothetical protein